VKHALLTIFSDGGNQDLDYAKCGGAVALIVFLAISFHAYFLKGVAFDPISWSTGVSMIIGCAAGVSKLKDGTGKIS